MTRAAAEIAHFVGWVEPTGRANARPMTGSAKPITVPGSNGGVSLRSTHQIGHARLQFGFARRGCEERGRKPANSDCPVDFVLEAHFRLKSDIAPCSFHASSAAASVIASPGGARTVAALRQSRPFRRGPVVLRFANRPRPPLLSAQFAFPGVAGTRPAQKSTATEGLRIYRSIRVRGVQKNGVHRCWHEPCIG